MRSSASSSLSQVWIAARRAPSPTGADRPSCATPSLPCQKSLGLLDFATLGIGVLRQLDQLGEMAGGRLAVAGRIGGTGGPQVAAEPVGRVLQCGLILAQRRG